MEIKNLLEITKREELREWLMKNHKTEGVCWVPSSVKPAKGSVLYLDIVEEALCFGWIDSTKKKLEDGRLVQRLSPRRKNGNWTELNKERVRRLEKLGLLTEAGRKNLPLDFDKPFVIAPEIIECIQNTPGLDEKFQALPDLYKRIRIDNIHGPLKAKDLELYQKRLDKFIDGIKQDKLIGDWHDSGRLLDY